MLTEIIAYIKTCPDFSEWELEGEFLREQAGNVSVRSLGEASLLQRYTDGSSLNQFVFAVCVRDDAFLHKTNGRKALEKLADFLVECERVQEGLRLKAGCSAQRFEVLNTAEVADNSFGSVRYEMKCRLIYYREEV